MSSLDLRILVVAAAAWAAAFGTWQRLVPGVVVIIVVSSGAVLVLRSRQRRWVVLAAATLAAAAGCASVSLKQAVIERNPVHEFADTRAWVSTVLILRSDPVLRSGRFGSQVSARATVVEIVVRGRVFAVRAPVLVRLLAEDRNRERGARLRVSGSLRPSDRPEYSGVLEARSAADLLAGPGGLAAVGNGLRASVRNAVEGRSAGPRALIPALVDGQDGDLSPQVVEDFNTSGMTHLLAVSGTNLTLIVGFLLVLARWAGVRAYGLIVVGLVGVIGFLVLAGSEPSVLRAAAMGTIALVGLGNGGQQRGIRALGLGVLVLVVADPLLARSVGFALSVAATTAILVLAPGWRDRLNRWLPRWAAEAVAVPLAAQLACTPLVAVLSDQVSLVAVVANVLAAPLIAPATVLGLLGGIVALVFVPVGRLIALPACWFASALIAIAHQAAALSLPAIRWSGTWRGAALLLVLCLGFAVVLPHLLARRSASITTSIVLAVVMIVPLPTPGWPPPGWVLVVCSVGQGDGIVLRVAEHAAVVVDAGPDPGPIDRCLSRLGIRQIPTVVLTHFHSDHVGGLAGVIGGREVGEIATSPLAEPAAGVADVVRIAGLAGIGVRAVKPGESGVLGALGWQVLAPTSAEHPTSDSPPNDASVVLLVEVAGIRILLMGDQERPSQSALRRDFPDLRADVLKVAHHGSSKQDEQLLRGLGARIALISDGLENDYGHPADSTLSLLQAAGMQIHRTDLAGDLAVVLTASGGLATVPRGRDVPGP